MQSLLFVTGNKRKVWQANDVLKAFHISVMPKELDVAEIQSSDPEQIALAKAAAAYEQCKEPLVINDHAWSIPALKGFPGGYMKDINHWFEPEDFLALMRDKTDRSANLTEMVVYTDGTEIMLFSSVFTGKMIDAPRGQGNVACERVVVFDGSDKTIAEHIDAGEHARNMDDSAWTKFGEWFSSREGEEA